MVGGVSSILTRAEAVLVLPATSVAVPFAVCPRPSCVRVTGEEQLATPDRVSEQAKFTLTLLLFQPKELARGARLGVMTGGVLSMLSTSVAPAVLPALSDAVPEML